MTMKPPFDWRKPPEAWRSVNAAVMARIANQCSTGVDFTSSPKKDILDWIAQPPPAVTTDPEKFKFMMDAVSKEMPRIKGEFELAVTQEITNAKDRYNQESDDQ